MIIRSFHKIDCHYKTNIRIKFLLIIHPGGAIIVEESFSEMIFL